MIVTMKIEIPVLGLVLHDGPFYDVWQPNRRYWSGQVVKIPQPFTTTENIQLGGEK